MMCWHKDKYIDQWNIIENPNINLYIYGQKIFDKKKCVENSMGERTVFSVNGSVTIAIHMQAKLDPNFKPHTKN